MDEKMKIGRYNIGKNGMHPNISNFENTPHRYFLNEGNSLQNKVALITGGYKGIGLAIVKSFLREGAKVVFTGRNKEQMKNVYDDLNNTNVSYMQWDIADKENDLSLMNNAFNIFGPIDVLINNAGIFKFNGKIPNFHNMTDEEFVLTQKINVMGTRNMCQNYIDLTGDRKGKIINIVSRVAFQASCGPYWISKWALLSYTKALGNIYKGKITVNGIAPGHIKTAGMGWIKGQSINLSSSPNGRIGLPEEIAELAVMLAGKKGDLISGQVFLCDGGQVLN
jgi:NAD(P)-dependent dehydrogenase (short-subunit alcohol dehydrogenase family)